MKTLQKHLKIIWYIWKRPCRILSLDDGKQRIEILDSGETEGKLDIHFSFLLRANKKNKKKERKTLQHREVGHSGHSGEQGVKS